MTVFEYESEKKNPIYSVIRLSGDQREDRAKRKVKHRKAGDQGAGVESGHS